MDFERDIARVSGIAAVSTILDVISRTTGMGFTAVARVTEDRWITCASRDQLAFGLKPGDELKVETTICHEIRQSRDAVVIENVSEDAGFSTHHTPAQYGFQSYISVPIILPDGSFFGTLCAIDPKPRKLRTPEIIGMFKLFAELIASHLDAAERVELIANRLALEQRNAELREQFIAVLGHDLRNPLASIQGGLRLLHKKVDDEGKNWINLLQGSVARMAGLIDNVMDFARARLGAGMQLKLREQALEPVIKQIVAEFENVHPDRVIETVVNVPGPVRIDADRIGQMLSNLLGNAISYGAADKPIRVLAQTTEAGFDISVVNKGAPIPADAIPRLFTAFDRGDVLPNQKGLGLGLYIAQEIVRAHGGLIVASSMLDETVFTASFPASG
ncbi:GAF domain-containing sensor histidine kinase [Bradyrhizobium sp. WSM471]|uniref:GAF domain-containing sensor histidine kinase n=1 Tax=Bradyrhizobium sp. WSM471 TaxID=319017 RepID=UPI00024D29E6|nr:MULTISPECIES: GAF domain-containing sensor histidine kinase [Bradyrhizobium]EHR05017.1 signal transduction histidine kinase [Bradyrhizobium sp. WSM471]UFW40146.1 GAF domain-containing sensor histidine kinase [Bradyrhizobium canariense]